MDGTGTNDRARFKTTTTTWATLKRLYLKPECPRARRYRFVASIELTGSQRHILRNKPAIYACLAVTWMQGC